MSGSTVTSTLPCPPFHITVIGLGAMGGGMARALVESDASKTVTGYDMSPQLCDAFYQETVVANKQYTGYCPPKTLTEATNKETQFVILVLQNELQCEQVCFGTRSSSSSSSVVPCLLSLVPKKCVLILCSTVTPTWAEKASTMFEKNDIYFIDCPISGGPTRARSGDLTLLSSANKYSEAILHEYAKPVLQAMSASDKWFIIPGNAGMGSTVKMVHQLLAGVHVVVAAEALALAAKAGLDVEQVYRIVNGAAGASWMFQDRGIRMIDPADDVDEIEIRSQLQIFVKDLDIVYSEAKRLQSPIPIATAALQQFISAQGLGLSTKDDSFVKRVYEKMSGVAIASKNGTAKHTSRDSTSSTVDTNMLIIEGDNVNESWKMEDGTYEQIVEVGMEPRHKVILQNEYIRALHVYFPSNDTTLAHRHAEDSIYFFLVEEGLQVVNHVKGYAPACDCMDYGEVRYGSHKSDNKPLVHKITNKSSVPMNCIDAEILKSPPITSPIQLMAPYHECIKVRDKCRIYKLTLNPGESVTTSYLFFHCTVILQGSKVENTISGKDKNPNNTIRWIEEVNCGGFSWKEPVMDLQKTNIGTTTYIEYIAEWR